LAILLVYAPANNDHGVIQILPGVSILVQGFGRNILCLLALALGLAHLRQLFETVCSEKSGRVSGKKIWCLELSAKGAITNDFLHHVCLTGLAVGAADIIRLANFCNWCAIFEVGALFADGGRLIRRTLLLNQVSLLSKVRVEVRPAALAPLGHVVAVQEHLW
jgi:hypothetical protein